ncbi:MAG: DMT family transporter [Syntrophorhabdales bacterium]|jgi:drug/metabolite transporter (DMT)-like permease
MKTLIVILIATMCTAVGETFLSLGMRRIGLENPSFWRWFLLVATNPFVLVGVFCVTCFFFLYLAALSWADLSFVMPLTALSYLFAAVLARVFLGEQISWLRWTGIFVIVVGIALVAAEERHQRTVDIRAKTALRYFLGKNRS